MLHTRYHTNKIYSYPSYLEKLSGVSVSNYGIPGCTISEWYEKNKNNDLSGYDVAIIQLGVNDAFRHGSLTDKAREDMKNIIHKLKKENKNIKIFIATIMQASSYHTSGTIKVSEEIRSLVKEEKDNNVILLDMEKYSHVGDSNAYNAGHLSALGYLTLANDYRNYISHTIRMNRHEFKEVQFTGTDKVSGY